MFSWYPCKLKLCAGTGLRWDSAVSLSGSTRQVLLSCHQKTTEQGAYNWAGDKVGEVGSPATPEQMLLITCSHRAASSLPILSGTEPLLLTEKPHEDRLGQPGSPLKAGRAARRARHPGHRHCIREEQVVEAGPMKGLPGTFAPFPGETVSVFPAIIGHGTMHAYWGL